MGRGGERNEGRERGYRGSREGGLKERKGDKFRGRRAYAEDPGEGEEEVH